MNKKDIFIPMGSDLRTVERNEGEALAYVVRVARRLGTKFFRFSSPALREQSVATDRTSGGSGAEIVARFLSQASWVTDQEFSLRMFVNDPLADVVILEEDLP